MNFRQASFDIQQIQNMDGISGVVFVYVCVCNQRLDMSVCVSVCVCLCVFRESDVLWEEESSQYPECLRGVCQEDVMKG